MTAAPACRLGPLDYLGGNYALDGESGIGGLAAQMRSISPCPVSTHSRDQRIWLVNVAGDRALRTIDFVSRPTADFPGLNHVVRNWVKSGIASLGLFNGAVFGLNAAAGRTSRPEQFSAA
jgi:hypothetical protein